MVPENLSNVSRFKAYRRVEDEFVRQLTEAVKKHGFIYCSTEHSEKLRVNRYTEQGPIYGEYCPITILYYEKTGRCIDTDLANDPQVYNVLGLDIGHVIADRIAIASDNKDHGFFSTYYFEDTKDFKDLRHNLLEATKANSLTD